MLILSSGNGIDDPLIKHPACQCSYITEELLDRDWEVSCINERDIGLTEAGILGSDSVMVLMLYYAEPVVVP